MKNFKDIITKVDAKKLWSAAGLAVTIIGTVVSNKNEAAQRQILKDELKEELLKDLLNEKN